MNHITHAFIHASTLIGLDSTHLDAVEHSFDCAFDFDFESLAMGCCASICESTPDVPKNIIADPEVRRSRSYRRRHHHHRRHHPSIHPSIGRVGVADADG